jgi:5'/3'-nucleotidase
MRILLTNDDGISAPGLQTLAESFSDTDLLTIAAPSGDRSAVSHGITIARPIFVQDVPVQGIVGHAIDGTPADCVKLAVDRLMNDRPDIVISGINQGANTGINIFYSGTVAAALEATLMGIPAMAVSMASYTSTAFQFAATVAKFMVMSGTVASIPKGMMLNVNIPNLPENEIQGIRITKQGEGGYRDCYVEYKDPKGRPYYWLTGNKTDSEDNLDIDRHALRAGWISVTPLQSSLNVNSNQPDFVEWLTHTLDRKLSDFLCKRTV